MPIWNGGGSIGEKALDFSISDKHVFGFAGETTLDFSKIEGFSHQWSSHHYSNRLVWTITDFDFDVEEL